MTNQEEKALREVFEKRLDRIEAKLDKHLEVVANHDAHLTWVRGYVRISAMFFLSLAGGLITTAARVFFMK